MPELRATAGGAEIPATEYEDPAEFYVIAAVGVSVAGGLFLSAVVTFATFMNVPSGQGVRLHEVGEALLFLVGSFVIGFFIAAAAALCLFPIVGVLDWMTSLSRWRGVLVSCAGGWCGFASVATLTRQAPSEGAISLGFMAMAMGQLGAGAGRAAAQPAKPGDVRSGSGRLGPAAAPAALRNHDSRCTRGRFTGLAPACAPHASRNSDRSCLPGRGSYRLLYVLRGMRSASAVSTALPLVPRETTGAARPD